LGRPGEAAEAARAWIALWPTNPVELYNGACTLALCASQETRTVEADHLAAEAVLALQSAISAGWSDANHTAGDPDLTVLHDRPDFQAALARLWDRSFPKDPFARGS
jgi:hypothetical protein